MATRKSLLKRLAIETGDPDLLEQTRTPSDLAFKRKITERISSAISDPIARGKILSRLKNAGPNRLRNAADKLGVNPDSIDDKRVDKLRSDIQKFDDARAKDTNVVKKTRQKLLNEAIEARLIQQEGADIGEQAQAQIEGTTISPEDEEITPRVPRSSNINVLAGLLSGTIGAGAKAVDIAQKGLTKIDEESAIVKNEEKRLTDFISSSKKKFTQVRQSGVFNSTELKKFEDGELRSEAIRRLELKNKPLDEEFIQNIMQQLKQRIEEFK